MTCFSETRFLRLRFFSEICFESRLTNNLIECLDVLLKLSEFWMLCTESLIHAFMCGLGNCFMSEATVLLKLWCVGPHLKIFLEARQRHLVASGTP